MQLSLNGHKLFQFLQNEFIVFLPIFLGCRLRVELSFLFHFTFLQPTTQQEALKKTLALNSVECLVK